jgi:hypothetical protein
MHLHFVEITCTKFHQNWSRDVESVVINVLKPFSTVGLSSELIFTKLTLA